MGLVIVPSPVNIIAMGNINKSLLVEKILIPMRNIEREIVINEDSQRMPIASVINSSLVSGVAVVDSRDGTKLIFHESKIADRF